VCVALVAGSAPVGVHHHRSTSLLRLSVTDMQSGVTWSSYARAGGGSGTSTANIDLPLCLPNSSGTRCQQASPQQNLASLADCPTVQDMSCSWWPLTSDRFL